MSEIDYNKQIESELNFLKEATKDMKLEEYIDFFSKNIQANFDSFYFDGNCHDILEKSKILKQQFNTYIAILIDKISEK